MIKLSLRQIRIYGIMEYTTIGESCSVVSGGTPSRSKTEYWRNGTIPWIKIGNIKSKYVNEYDELITEQGLNNSSAKLLKKGTILYTIFATLGEVGILDTEACTNQAIAGININDPRITTDYLYYYLKSKKDYVNNIGRGVAQNNINLTTLKKFEIPLINVDKQLYIVEVLEKVERMIGLKKKEIDDLDLLIKARFIEMFGDPEINLMGWAKRPLSSVIVNANNGMARRGNDKDGNIVMRLVELQDGYIDYSNPNRITLQDSEKKRYLLKDKDFLFARVNGNPNNVGRCAVFHDIGEDVYHNDHIIRVHFNELMLNGTFASVLFNSDYGKQQLRGQIKTSAGQYTVSQDGIGAIIAIMPPIELQNQFADFAKQIDKSKLAVQQSLEKTQLLFDSLMQEYFGEN